MSYQNLIGHIGRSPVRTPLSAQSIKLDGFMGELSSLVRGRLEHEVPETKWKWMQAKRKLEAFENRNAIMAYARLRIHEGADRSDLQEQIIAEYLLPQVAEQDTPVYNPYDHLWSESPVMNARSITDTVLSKMAAGVPGFKVKDVAWEYKMQPADVEVQLRAYVSKKSVQRVDEVAEGTARKMRFLQSIENLPETFFDFSPYKPRLTGVGDCAVISLAVAENKDYSAVVAATSDITQEGGGVRTIDFKEYLSSRSFTHEPVDAGVSLENFWNSDVIDISDSGIIRVCLEGDGLGGSHVIGFRDGRMYVPDPILVSQFYASAAVTEVWFKKASDSVAMARAIKRQTSSQVQVVHEQTLTEVELEALKGRLVNEILSNLSSQLGIESIREVA